MAVANMSASKLHFAHTGTEPDPVNPSEDSFNIVYRDIGMHVQMKLES